VLLFATVVLTGCRLAEHGRRAAIDAFASFVLDSVFRMQSAAPLTEKAPAVARAEVPEPKVEAFVTVTAEASQPAITIAIAAAPLPLPAPQPHIAAISLAPAAEACRIKRVYAFPYAARATVSARAMATIEARMAVAQLRGEQLERVRRVFVVAEPVIDPATL